MKRLCIVFTILTLCLSACVTRPTENVTDKSTAVPTSEEPLGAPEIYRQALTRLLEEHIDPDPEFNDRPYEDHEWELLGQIEFAVCDVDVDGEQELVMRYADTYMAGQYTAVYRYDAGSGALKRAGIGAASCLFYDNAVMLDPISHNQGWAGSFWPFTVLRYDKTMQEYREVAFVDAWDREFMEDYDIPGYPEEADDENAGFVYYIYEVDGEGLKRWDDAVEPVSQSVYDAWYDSIFGGATEIRVKYLPLTQENIAAVSGS